MKEFANFHRGETCVIIGNGPSLNQTPLDKLGEKYITFGSNRIFEYPFTPTYYSIVDKLMLKACLPLPQDFNPIMFLRAEACVENNNPIYPIVVNGFSPDPSNFVVIGGTVTYVLLQLAFFMDFKNVLLVGVDHNYPKTGRLEEGIYFVAGEQDPDHFATSSGKPYFETGKEYAAPSLTGTTQSYQIAKHFYDEFGKKIINLTPNTKLDVFEKGSFDEW